MQYHNRNMDKNQALALLRPHYNRIIDVGDDSYREFKAKFLDTGIAISHKNRTLAGIINDIYSRNMRESFKNVPGVYHDQRYAADIFYFGNELRVRIKKLDNRSYLPKNIQTGNSLKLFNDTEYLIPGKLLTLALGYTTDEARTVLSWPYIVCTAGMHKASWVVTKAEIYESLNTKVARAKIDRKDLGHIIKLTDEAKKKSKIKKMEHEQGS